MGNLLSRLCSIMLGFCCCGGGGGDPGDPNPMVDCEICQDFTRPANVRITIPTGWISNPNLSAGYDCEIDGSYIASYRGFSGGIGSSACTWEYTFAGAGAGTNDRPAAIIFSYFYGITFNRTELTAVVVWSRSGLAIPTSWQTLLSGLQHVDCGAVLSLPKSTPTSFPGDLRPCQFTATTAATVEFL